MRTFLPFATLLGAAFLLGCQEQATEPEISTSPSAAVVSSFSNNQMNAFAGGDNVFLFVSNRKVNLARGSQPTKSVNLVVETFSASSFCFDAVPLSKGDFSLSMSHAEVNASTACGQVIASWSSTGPVTTNNFEGWFSSPPTGIRTCSPPPGSITFHNAIPDQRVPASASGTIGGSPFTASFAILVHVVVTGMTCQ